MGNPAYDTQAVTTSDGLKYLFISKGRRDIVKAIQYRYVQNFAGHRLYNLGFGDYNISTDEIFDDSNSNNGDVYAVFYTVLNTIPTFFEVFPQAVLMISGSDSTPKFETDCRKDCLRKCGVVCKKRNRRIHVYCDYVNKNFVALNKEYEFYGGVEIENEIELEAYQLNKQYSTVFLRKR